MKYRLWDKNIQCYIESITENYIDNDGNLIVYDEYFEKRLNTNNIEIEYFVGKTDKNNKDIYENDIIVDNNNNKGFIYYSNHFQRWQIYFFEGNERLTNNLGYGKHIFDWLNPNSLIVISNIHKDKISFIPEDK